MSRTPARNLLALLKPRGVSMCTNHMSWAEPQSQGFCHFTSGRRELFLSLQSCMGGCGHRLLARDLNWKKLRPNSWACQIAHRLSAVHEGSCHRHDCVLACKGRLRFTVSREIHCSSVASNESSQTEFPQHLLFLQMRLVKAAPSGFKIVRDDGNLPGKMAYEF